MNKILAKNKNYVKSTVYFDDLGKYIIDELGVPYAAGLAWLLYKVVALYIGESEQLRFIDKRGFMNMFNDDFKIGVTDATLNKYFKDLAELNLITKEIRYESKRGSVKAYMYIKPNVEKLQSLRGYSARKNHEEELLKLFKYGNTKNE